MKGSGAKLIVVHPSIHNHPATRHHRLWLLLFLSFFTFTFLLALINTKHSPSSTAAYSAASNRLSKPISDALLHYAATANATDRMSPAEMEAVAAALRGCIAPCNFLVFGLTHETLLWKGLNQGGRTVFLDENEYLISKYEQSISDFEAYDVQYTTKVSELRKRIESVQDQRRNECRPVQNLLFSNCEMGINDLPNHLYSIPWDLILVDGPRGYSPKMPGRMSAIFTAAVLARSKRGGGEKTHVFVHEFEREVERVCSDEFLCRENLVETQSSLAHFVLEKMEPNCYEFCTERRSPAFRAAKSSSGRDD
ncbi:hypothetical protein Nepgr_018144 [Nepenthes gracilis]|uniref:Polysaccharide biosynthesis domain-containing protein n=1 Tax=Nepenthes gracilis TaxID=150966 RepID=A0AAD3XT70_NEPGR|nr:hypothetical protein Nepgr_018144 [Nepenthes gracilis]